jgi:hypothetical protein
MLIGHISLDPDADNAAANFVLLVEALGNAGLQQHILVGDYGLTSQLSAIEGVTVGPVVHSPVMAYCLLPRVDVAHCHNIAAGHAGLLLTLTRSIPYVLTRRGGIASDVRPPLKSIYRRASCILCQNDAEIAMLRHWLPGLAVEVLPDLGRYEGVARYLGVYQNSQSTPIAGSNGVQ